MLTRKESLLLLFQKGMSSPNIKCMALRVESAVDIGTQKVPVMTEQLVFAREAFSYKHMCIMSEYDDALRHKNNPSMRIVEAVLFDDIGISGVHGVVSWVKERDK